MRRSHLIFRLALAALSLTLVAAASGQTRRTGRGRTTAATTPAQSAAVAAPVMLPASDGLVLVELRRILTEAMPRVMAGDTARMSEVNADIEQFKARTGIDARSIERVAVGVRFTNPSPEVTKIDNVVAVASGKFDAATLVAAGRQTSAGGYREENHGGKTVYVFNFNERMKFFGVMPNLMVKEVAMSLLDANTLVVGEPEAVRATIDAGAGRTARVSSELVALARRQPGALLGFAANIPRSVLSKVDGLGNDDLTRSVNSIRQIFGSLAPTPAGFDVLTNVRAATAADARKLSDTITALKPLGGLYASQQSGDKGRLLQKVVNDLQVTAQGTDVQLKLPFTQADISTMLRVF